MTVPFSFVNIFGVPIAPLSCSQTLQSISRALEQRQTLSIDTANTMVISSAATNSRFRTSLASFDLVVPDAMPLSWYMRLIGFPFVEPCYGPVLTKMVTERFGHAHAILIIGSTRFAQKKFLHRFKGKFSWITRVINPYRQSDITYLVRHIHSSKPDIIFLALGYPKQYLIMAGLKPHIKHCVVIGVGGSIDLVAGIRPIAPKIIRLLGLNWLFRLILEPKRLWKRYLIYNTLFLYLCIKHFYSDYRQTIIHTNKKI